MRRRKPGEPSFCIITLGCPKNLVDSEKIAGFLTKEGWLLVGTPEDVDVVILNTCAFIPPAREEADRKIQELGRLKREGLFRFLVVAGCLPLFYGTDAPLPPYTDMLLTPPHYGNAPSLLRFLLEGKRVRSAVSPIRQEPDDSVRLILTPPHYAFLRISDGCSNRCSFCTVPRIRGRHRPKPAAEVIGEAEALASTGVKELIVVAQDTTAFRAPDTGENLPTLIKRICRVDGLEWIRLMYAHPARLTPELVEVIATEPKVVRYIDIPVQHINERILRLMGRAGGARAVRRALSRLRSIDDIAVRTTVLLGFPTETEDEFRELMDFLEEFRFERLGVFPFYPEGGTKAAELPQLPPEVREFRADAVMRLQQRITFDYTKTLIGKEEKVLLDSFDGREFEARTYRDAPQIDAVCRVRTGRYHKVGSFLKVRFTQASGYDIIAEPVS